MAITDQAFRAGVQLQIQKELGGTPSGVALSVEARPIHGDGCGLVRKWFTTRGWGPRKYLRPRFPDGPPRS